MVRTTVRNTKIVLVLIQAPDIEPYYDRSLIDPLRIPLKQPFNPEAPATKTLGPTRITHRDIGHVEAHHPKPDYDRGLRFYCMLCILGGRGGGGGGSGQKALAG